MELIRKHKNIEEILKNIDTKKYAPPENWLFREARTLFMEPEAEFEKKNFFHSFLVENCKHFLDITKIVNKFDTFSRIFLKFLEFSRKIKKIQKGIRKY